jgi:hypothetical protein
MDGSTDRCLNHSAIATIETMARVQPLHFRKRRVRVSLVVAVCPVLFFHAGIEPVPVRYLVWMVGIEPTRCPAPKAGG